MKFKFWIRKINFRLKYACSKLILYTSKRRQMALFVVFYGKTTIPPNVKYTKFIAQAI